MRVTLKNSTADACSPFGIETCASENRMYGDPFEQEGGPSDYVSEAVSGLLTDTS